MCGSLLPLDSLQAPCPFSLLCSSLLASFLMQTPSRCASNLVNSLSQTLPGSSHLCTFAVFVGLPSTLSLLDCLGCLLVCVGSASREYYLHELTESAAPSYKGRWLPSRREDRCRKSVKQPYNWCRTTKVVFPFGLLIAAACVFGCLLQ